MKAILGWLILVIAALAILIGTLILSFKIVPSITTSYAVWIYDNNSEYDAIVLKATLVVERRVSHRHITLSTAYDALYNGDIYQVDRESHTIADYGADNSVLESTNRAWSIESLGEILDPYQTHIRELSDAELHEIKSVIDDIIDNGYDGMFYALKESPSQHKKMLVLLDAYGPASSPFAQISYGWVPVWFLTSSVGIWVALRLSRPLRKTTQSSVHCDAQTHGSASGRES